MNHLINFLRKHNDGYVSIEVVIIGGLVVGFGALTLESFGQASSVPVNKSVNTIQEKMEAFK